MNCNKASCNPKQYKTIQCNTVPKQCNTVPKQYNTVPKQCNTVPKQYNPIESNTMQ